MGTARIGRFIPVQPKTGTRSAHYRAIPPIEAASTPLPPKIGRRKRCFSPCVGFMERASFSPRLTGRFLLPAQASQEDISSPNAGRRSISSRGEKE
ncbi:hypothetical protein B296_00018051 [Ensete ventricosum]|uniref:Uncharacterized protein n=1 Tax=Ensete ventricosum TaxID=4639 RepID=A0A426ZMS0_ENSVE|nr:hypothetical protein B296_00018051 [Ensete ventricosum]